MSQKITARGHVIKVLDHRGDETKYNFPLTPQHSGFSEQPSPQWWETTYDMGLSIIFLSTSVEVSLKPMMTHYLPLHPCFTIFLTTKLRLTRKGYVCNGMKQVYIMLVALAWLGLLGVGPNQCCHNLCKKANMALHFTSQNKECLVERIRFQFI